MSGHMKPGDAARETPADRPSLGDAVPSLSPGLLGGSSFQSSAYELKFLVSAETADALQKEAAGFLRPDPFAEPAGDGSYRTTTLYLDTAARDVLNRTPGFRARKFRLRRYGDAAAVYLEEKVRRGSRVRKRRVQVSDTDLTDVVRDDPLPEHPAEWFRGRIVERRLVPSCRISYRRTAFFDRTDSSALRLTFDREIRGAAEASWRIVAVRDGQPLLGGDVIFEMKFNDVMPAAFKRLIADHGLATSAVSKYRRFMEVVNGGPVNGGAHA